ncbi:DUF1542 domain-containing protein, partial [Streptococcus suis]|nr:DUF1542 domain-containing protein [Streptococcus suis]
MNRSKKKSFDWYGARQRFSIRKYHIGAASVLLGTTLVLGTGTIVGAETGVNGDGASNGQIVPGNGTGTSDGTQPQGDNQGNNSSGVQTGNTTNSTANDQSANDTSSASGQPVGTSRSANTGTQGDGTTNQPVDEPIIKFPTQDDQRQPAGYQKVEFRAAFSQLVFEGNPGEIYVGSEKRVVFWVLSGTTWGDLKKQPQFRIPSYSVDKGDFVLGFARLIGGQPNNIDLDTLDTTPITETWLFNTVVDYIVGDVKDGKTFEEYMNSGSYAKFHIPQFHGITLDANGGTIDGKEKKAFYVAYQHVQWGDQLVTKKIDDASNKASRDGYTFVRWQTATGGGIPTSGQIDTIEFTAVWLEHPTEAVKVFNPEQLSETDKTKVADLIRSVNPDLQNSIQEITVANNGDATVRFTTGEERTISGASLVSDNSAEQRTKARDSILDAVLQKQDDIAKSQLTAKEQQDKLDKLRELQESIEEQIDGATSEDALDKIVEDGKNSIENFDLTSATKKDQAKQDLEKAYNAEKAEIENSVLTVDEKATKQAELTTAKEKAIKAVDDATTDSAVEGALKNGKATIESTYTAVIKFPSSTSETAPEGYVTVTFNKSPWDKGLTLGNQSGNSVRIFVKNDVTWATLLSDPAWQWPTVNTNSGDIVVGWGSHTNYSASVAFVYDKMKDQVVRNTQLWPNVVYEVEDVHSTIDAYLKQYGADEQDKWLFVTFDAGQGATLKGTTNQSKSVAVYYQNIGYDNSLFTKKVVNGVLANHTFVRWQTADGKVLPTSGTITSTEVYNALYLAHPQNKVAVFDSTKLTDSEKEQVKQKIYDANPNLSTGVPQVIKAIDISDTGEATVTFDDGTVVKVPSATLTNEDKATARSNAKAEIEKDAMEKSAAINASTLTNEEKAAKLADVQDAKDRADIAIDKATTTEDLTKAISDGTAAIKAVSTTSTIKTKAKEALEEAYNAEKAEIENSVLTADEKVAKQAELTTAKEKAIKAVDDATTDSAVEGALKNGKATIESTYTAVIKFPSSTSETAPEGYVTVTFNKSPWDKGLTLGNQSGNSVRIFVKNDVTWATLLSDPAWQWPTVNTNSGDIVVGWGSHTNYSASVAFVYDKMKDQVVRNTQLWPNVVYEVEDVHSTIDAYLKQYGADEQDKWLFVTFDAGQGATLKGTTNQSKSVAVYYQNIGYDNSLFTKKVVNGVLANHTFVRWQTADGKVLPTSGTITSTEVYNALYLAHPTDKTTVFDANKLTETEKDSLKQAISNANPTSANLIQSITVSDTGEAKVTYNDGTVVTVPASDLINEDKEPARNLAKAEIDKASKEKVAEINASALTDEEKTAKLTEVQEAKDRANNAIDNATTTEDLTKALEDGKSEIDAINTTTSPKKAVAKQTLEDAYNTKKDAITNSGLTAEEKDAKQAELDKAKEDADKAIDAATDNAGVDTALEAGKTAIAGIDTSTSPKKAAAKEELKAVADDAKKAIDANDNLTDAEKQAAKDAVDAEVAKAEKAIDAATKADEVDAATLAGTAAITADVLDAAKLDAKNKIAKDVEAANAAIESNPNLSEDEKKGFKDAVDAEAAKAVADIEKATTPEAAQAAEEAGTAAIAEDVLDAAKQDAKNKIAKDLATVEAAIEANSNLSEDEKKAAKLAAQAKAAEAVADIEKATTPEAAQTLEDAAVKDLANIEIKAAYDDAVKAIEAADNLSTAAKTQALEDLKKARQAAEE